MTVYLTGNKKLWKVKYIQFSLIEAFILISFMIYHISENHIPNVEYAMTQRKICYDRLEIFSDLALLHVTDRYGSSLCTCLVVLR